MVCCLGWGLDMFRLGDIATGGKTNPSYNLPFMKWTLCGWLCGSLPEGWGRWPLRLGGLHFGWGSPWLGEVGRAHFFQYIKAFALQLRESWEIISVVLRLAPRQLWFMIHWEARLYTMAFMFKFRLHISASVYTAYVCVIYLDFFFRISRLPPIPFVLVWHTEHNLIVTAIKRMSLRLIVSRSVRLGAKPSVRLITTGLLKVTYLISAVPLWSSCGSEVQKRPSCVSACQHTGLFSAGCWVARMSPVTRLPKM